MKNRHLGKSEPSRKYLFFSGMGLGGRLVQEFGGKRPGSTYRCVMKEIFRERDLARVGYCQSILEGEGIPTVVRNETLTGLTEFPIPDFFPALCVVNDEDYPRAIALLRDRLASDQSASSEEIDCASCGELNPGNFEVCWSCGGAVRPRE